MSQDAGFPKREHLCLQRDIDALFAEPDGTASAWPLRCLWRSSGDDKLNQVLISVAKRRLHHAVDRNRAKRQIREAYRLQKGLLRPGLHLAFIWLADAPQSTDKVSRSMRRLLKTIAEKAQAVAPAPASGSEQ